MMLSAHSVSVAAAVTAFGALIAELLERWLHKYHDRKRPRLTPAGYMRDEAQMKKERLAIESYTPIKGKIEFAEKALSTLKLILIAAAALFQYLQIS
jgi:hypothetical protein